MRNEIVQLIRNALCCVKDWNLFNSTILYDSQFTSYVYALPFPLNQATLLEILISTTQYYAFWSLGRSGFRMMSSALFKFNCLMRLLDYRANNTTKTAQHRLSLADTLINDHLLLEGERVLRATLVGFMNICIGISFFWLFANSWHVTSTYWLGGIRGLIHALTMMEICLIPLLYYMWTDGNHRLAQAQLMLDLAGRIESLETLSVEELELLTGWHPIWSLDVKMSLADLISTLKDQEYLDREVKIVKSHLNHFIVKRSTVRSASSKTESKEEDNEFEKEAKIRAEEFRAKADELRSRAQVTRYKGYREYLYFLLNAIAFYGYLLGILAYYFDDYDEMNNNSPGLSLTYYASFFKLGMNNVDSDWRGNFAGNLMWTIEPIVFLISSAIFYRLSVKAAPTKKVKSD